MQEVDPEEWPAGERVGAHELVRPVGRGGMAIVFEARHVELGGRAALKVLRGEQGRRPQVRERFLREGIAVARVRHPHVLRVFDVGEHRGAAWLLMEYIEGQSLRARLSKGAALPVELALELMLPVIAAVAAAHDEGVIHRDLKPANIMLERLRDGGTRPVVVDFGIARLEGPEAGRAITQQDAIVGTPAYLSPEQVHKDGAVSPGSDQWSTAVVLYECLTGRKAFPGSSVLDVLGRVAAASFDAPRALRPELPEPLEAALLRALDADPARRHRSMRAFGRALLPFASERVRVVWERAFVSDDDVTGVHALSAPPPIEPAPEAPAATPLALVSPSPPLAASQVGARPRRVAAGTAGAAVLVALSAALARHCGPAQRAPYRAAVAASPATATIAVDGASTVGRFEGDFAADGVAHELRVEAPGCEAHWETFVNAPPTPRVTLRCRGAEAPPRAAAPAPVVVVAPPAQNAAEAPAPRGRRAGRPSRRARGLEAAPAETGAVEQEPAHPIGSRETPNL